MKCRYLFEILISMSLVIFPEVRQLVHVVAILLNFWETSVLFSIVSAPIYVPANNVQGFPFLHILKHSLSSSSFCLIIAILTGIRCYHFVILICISLWLVVLSVFSCTYRPFTSLFWKTIPSLPLSILKIICFIVMHCRSFIYSGY